MKNARPLAVFACALGLVWLAVAYDQQRFLKLHHALPEAEPFHLGPVLPQPGAVGATDAKISALAAGAPMALDDSIPIARSGSNFKLTGNDISGEQCTKTLTEGAATNVVQVSVASGAGAGGVLTYHAFASDGTDHQSLAGSFYFSAVNKAGTLSLGGSGTPNALGTSLQAASSGTLTCTPTIASTTNAINLQLNCTSSLTQNVFTAWTRVELIGGGTPTCQ